MWYCDQLAGLYATYNLLGKTSRLKWPILFSSCHPFVAFDLCFSLSHPLSHALSLNSLCLSFALSLLRSISLFPALSLPFSLLAAAFFCHFRCLSLIPPSCSTPTPLKNTPINSTVKDHKNDHDDKKAAAVQLRCARISFVIWKKRLINSHCHWSVWQRWWRRRRRWLK